MRSADRDRSHPLVIAGGHACLNPEPMAAFIDAFVIGEGEDVMLEIAEAVLEAKQAGVDRPAAAAEAGWCLGSVCPWHVRGRVRRRWHTPNRAPSFPEARCPVLNESWRSCPLP